MDIPLAFTALLSPNYSRFLRGASVYEMLLGLDLFGFFVRDLTFKLFF